jgi:hypothetical protein
LNDDSVNDLRSARRNSIHRIGLAERPGVAFRLLSWYPVENETEARDRNRREVAGTLRREDRLDAILRWVHRLLNPPSATPATASSRRRVRDRVPL